MSKCVVQRQVPPKDAGGLPILEWLHFNSDCFAGLEWEWKKEMKGCHIFAKEEFGEAKLRELNEKEGNIMIYGSEAQQLRDEIPSDEVYRRTCKRMGERED